MENLGQQLGEHKGRFVGDIRSLMLGGMFLFGILSGITMSVAQLLVLIGSSSRSESDVSTLGYGILITLGSILLSALFLLPPVLRLKQSVVVFERGLILNRLWRKTMIIRHNDVQDVEVTRFTTFPGPYYYEIYVYLTSRRGIAIVGVSEAEQLANFLRQWSKGGVSNSAAATGWQPPTTAGWAPPENQVGQPPQVGGGGWTPPVNTGGQPPQVNGGGWIPPASRGGWTPPTNRSS